MMMALDSLMSLQCICPGKLLPALLTGTKGAILQMDGLMARQIIRSAEGLVTNVSSRCHMITNEVVL
jgi:hypothetical protein